nr:SLAP domain-containing protein [Lysinibacillus timonensis]
MQQLQFESSWDKALSVEDRRTIEKIFYDTKYFRSIDILFSPIREAINHKEELLVTVLVHNFTESPLNFKNTKMQYNIHDEVIANNVFTLPSLIIPPNVSMPWTFIFPKGSYIQKTSYKNGQLEIS